MVETLVLIQQYPNLHDVSTFLKHCQLLNTTPFKHYHVENTSANSTVTRVLHWSSRGSWALAGWVDTGWKGRRQELKKSSQSYQDGQTTSAATSKGTFGYQCQSAERRLTISYAPTPGLDLFSCDFPCRLSLCSAWPPGRRTPWWCASAPMATWRRCCRTLMSRFSLLSPLSMRASSSLALLLNPTSLSTLYQSRVYGSSSSRFQQSWWCFSCIVACDGMDRSRCSFLFGGSLRTFSFVFVLGFLSIILRFFEIRSFWGRKLVK